jgi:DNA-binding NarL/FixJ family response regulator
MPINVAVVEDDRDFRTSLSSFVNDAPGFRCVCACDTAEDALKVIPSLLPDVVLMDIHLPNMSGILCTGELKRLCPTVQILILTVYEDTERIFGALEAGACGYLLKRVRPADILSAIQDVKLGGAPMSSQIARRVIESFHAKSPIPSKKQELSPREECILEELAKGYRVKEIASRLSVSAGTVHTHLKNIYEKLHVHSRTEAVLKYLGQPYRKN